MDLNQAGMCQFGSEYIGHPSHVAIIFFPGPWPAVMIIPLFHHIGDNNYGLTFCKHNNMERTERNYYAQHNN